MLRMPGQCDVCANESDEVQDENGRWVCAAFPDGIPDDIYHSRFDHREAYPGDRGIRFVPSTSANPALVEHVIGVWDRVKNA